MWHRAIQNSMVKAQHVNEGVVEDAGNVLLELSVGLAKGKGKAKAVTTKSRGKKSNRDAGQVQPVAATTQQFGATTIPGSYFTPPTTLQTWVLTAATTGTATSTSTPSGTVAAPANLLNKEDIWRQVKERRRQLSKEIAKAKIQLWETTIEQGCRLILKNNCCLDYVYPMYAYVRNFVLCSPRCRLTPLTPQMQIFHQAQPSTVHLSAHIT
jgi:hypothetical protein